MSLGVNRWKKQWLLSLLYQIEPPKTVPNQNFVSMVVGIETRGGATSPLLFIWYGVLLCDPEICYVFEWLQTFSSIASASKVLGL